MKSDSPKHAVKSHVLDGIRVLDLTQMVAGPLCTLLLGDLGADVIKVEPPDGDSSRQIGLNRNCGESDYFLSLNRNKRSIILDLKTAVGLETLKELAKVSDIVVENFRPGTMEKLGIGWDVLYELNPRLILCSMSGFGQSGPYRDRPALDPVIQAISGVMQLTGSAESGPLKTGVLISDFVPPLFATIGVMSALLNRFQTNLGQRVDVAMLDATVFSMLPREGFYFATGCTPERLGNGHYQISPWNTYPTQDGRHIMIVAHTEKFWKGLVMALGRNELLSDERFVSNASRLEHRTQLDVELSRSFVKEDLSHWTKRLSECGVLFAPVRDFDEVFADPVIREGIVQTVNHPTAGPVEVLRNPIKLSASNVDIRRPPPLLGEHTQEILAELNSINTNAKVSSSLTFPISKGHS